MTWLDDLIEKIREEKQSGEAPAEGLPTGVPVQPSVEAPEVTTPEVATPGAVAPEEQAAEGYDAFSSISDPAVREYLRKQMTMRDAAEKEVAKRQLLTALPVAALRGFGGYVGGRTGHPGAYDPDVSGITNWANRPVSNLEERQARESQLLGQGQKKVAYGREEKEYASKEALRTALQDPNSPETAIRRGLAKKVYPTLKAQIDSMTGAQIEAALPGIAVGAAKADKGEWTTTTINKNGQAIQLNKRTGETRVMELGVPAGSVTRKPSALEKAKATALGKELATWQLSGQAQYQSERARLQKAGEGLAASAESPEPGLISGRVVGRLPNYVRSEASLATQQNVEQAVLGALRATLGAQFTENEGTRILGIYFDPTLSEAENLARVNNLMKKLDSIAATKNEMLQYAKDHTEDDPNLMQYGEVFDPYALAAKFGLDAGYQEEGSLGKGQNQATPIKGNPSEEQRKAIEKWGTP